MAHLRIKSTGNYMKTLAIANQKGGMGKTTLAVHLVYMAMESGYRTLLIDMDPQGSASLSFPPAEGAEAGLVASELISVDGIGVGPERVSDLLSIVRSDKRTLGDASTGGGQGVRRARQNLAAIAASYDICIIDTPGNLQPSLTESALAAADAVVCPVSVGLYEAAALNDLWSYLLAVRKTHNPRLRLMGMLPSKVNTRSAEEMAGLEAIRARHRDQILPEMLAENAAVKKAIARRIPVWRGTRGAGHMQAAKQWRSVCQYLIAKLGVQA